MSTNVYTKEKKAELAEKAWPELVLIAEQKGTIFYNELGSKIGIYNPEEVHHALSPIQSYCCDPNNKVPLLNSLVVKKPPNSDPNRTPEPGVGCIRKGTHKEDKDAVHAFDWKKHSNPGYAVLLGYATE